MRNVSKKTIKRDHNELIIISVVLIALSVVFTSTQGAKESFQQELREQSPTAQVARMQSPVVQKAAVKDDFTKIIAKAKRETKNKTAHSGFMTAVSRSAKENNPYPKPKWR